METRVVGLGWLKFKGKQHTNQRKYFSLSLYGSRLYLFWGRFYGGPVKNLIHFASRITVH